MITRINKAIYITFYLLFFSIPLILFHRTSELFEFNKMVLTYILTISVVTFWLTKSIVHKKIIFKRTLLDLPLLIFLGTQLLSTITSIDFRTSLLGYYSRYHGGLASSMAYALLYWAYVSNMDKEKTLKSIYFLLSSAALVSTYGVLEHFGIDKDIWVQDVQNRVFSTLGQPNWLAAWLVTILPLTWAFTMQNTQNKSQNINIGKFWLYFGLSSLLFLTLLYTKSRSGMLGFVSAFVVFWVLVLWKKKGNFFQKDTLSRFIILNSSFLILILFVGTPWTPNLESLRKIDTEPIEQEKSTTAPLLETGGTASSEIRKIVWQGAIDIWKNYPILGTGVETFAFSYYSFRPVEHNLVSEWDFLYNKAHNEYLNILATTGTVGFISYLALVSAIIFQILKQSGSLKSDGQKRTLTSNFLLPISLLSGFTSILVTNFFGFSVVPVGILFFLYPAMATVSSKNQEASNSEIASLTSQQKIAVSGVLLITCYLLLITSRYWYADYLYATGKVHNDADNIVEAKEYLEKAVKLSPKEAIFRIELSEADCAIALALLEENNADSAQQFVDSAIKESSIAEALSPNNVNIKRKSASMFIKLSSFDPTYLLNAKDTILEAIKLAPTDAKLFYNLGLAYLRTGDTQKAIVTLQETIDMKSNYRDARFALALVYIDNHDTEKAKEQLEYILERINLNDKMAKQQLEELK